MSNLDDFFAKKDRKKSTTKTNLLVADELYRSLEEAAKAPPEAPDSSEKQQQHQLEVANSTIASLEFGIRFSDEAIDVEDEWCDFTEEHDQPFPNLNRCSKLALGAATAVGNEVLEVPLVSEQCQDTGGDGLDVGRVIDEPGTIACPWFKLEPTELSSPELPLAVGLQKETKAQPINLAKKPVYVPPALRQCQSEFRVRHAKQSTAGPVKLAKGQAPDLNNVDFFPSLSHSRTSKRAK